MNKQENLELKTIFDELRKGNKKIIEKLYQKYYKMIYGIVFSILKNKDDSEDVVQVVFSKLYEIDKEKMPKDNEATWLYSVTKNETLMFLRNKNQYYDIETLYNIENGSNDIDKLIDKESYNQLIDKLDNKEKEIISLKVLSGLSFNQISELLGEPIGTIKWRYYKSIYALKIMLSNLGMFVITFILGITTFKQTKKSEDIIIKDEITEDSATTTDKENNKEFFENDIESDKTQENIIVQEPVTVHNTNYLGYGILSVSSVFFVITIIFVIILRKHQLKLNKKSSK